MKTAWSATAALPGSEFGALGRAAAREALFTRFPQIAAETLRGIFRRHGTRAMEIVGDGDLGEDYGAGLYERELRYLVEREWACSAEDVLWRRTKTGLHLSLAQRERVAERMGR